MKPNNFNSLLAQVEAQQSKAQGLLDRVNTVLRDLNEVRGCIYRLASLTLENPDKLPTNAQKRQMEQYVKDYNQEFSKLAEATNLNPKNHE